MSKAIKATVLKEFSDRYGDVFRVGEECSVQDEGATFSINWGYMSMPRTKFFEHLKLESDREILLTRFPVKLLEDSFKYWKHCPHDLIHGEIYGGGGTRGSVGTVDEVIVFPKRDTAAGYVIYTLEVPYIYQSPDNPDYSGNSGFYAGTKWDY